MCRCKMIAQADGAETKVARNELQFREQQNASLRSENQATARPEFHTLCTGGRCHAKSLFRVCHAQRCHAAL